MNCTHTRSLAGVYYCCELQDGHGGDHTYAITAGQLHAIEHTLTHPKRVAFPSEAMMLFIAAIMVELWASQRTALDHAASLVMIATAIRWVRIWLNERQP